MPGFELVDKNRKRPHSTPQTIFKHAIFNKDHTTAINIDTL